MRAIDRGGQAPRRRVPALLAVLVLVLAAMPPAVGAQADYPTQADLNGRIIFHPVIQNPRCVGSTTTITPPDVMPLFAAKEFAFFLPVLYGYDPSAGAWQVVHIGHWSYTLVDGSIDRTGLPTYYGGSLLTSYWVQLPDNQPPTEAVRMNAGWFYQWLAYVWWQGTGYTYSTVVSPVHNELVLGQWTWTAGCDRRST